MKADNDKIPVNTAAKSGITKNHAAAANIPKKDKDLIKLIQIFTICSLISLQHCEIL